MATRQRKLFFIRFWRALLRGGWRDSPALVCGLTTAQKSPCFPSHFLFWPACVVVPLCSSCWLPASPVPSDKAQILTEGCGGKERSRGIAHPNLWAPIGKGRVLYVGHTPKLSNPSACLCLWAALRADVRKLKPLDCHSEESNWDLSSMRGRNMIEI